MAKRKKKEIKKIIIKKPVETIEEATRPDCFGCKADYCLESLCEWFNECFLDHLECLEDS